MLKKFNNNESYFKCYNKYSNEIKIQRIDIKEKIIVRYEKSEKSDYR